MPSAPGGLARAARDQARAILSKPPFSTAHSSSLQRFFHDLGQWLYDAFGPIYRFLVHHVFRPTRDGLSVVFGPWWPVVLGAIVLAAALTVGVALARRRARVGTIHGGRAVGARDEDPDELDRASGRAERDGDYDTAVRLRFRAGLARLERTGLIRDRRTHTTAQLAEMLRSPTFDALAARVDVVVYGGVAATADDVTAARAGWPRVPAEAHGAAGRSLVAAVAGPVGAGSGGGGAGGR